MGDAGEGLVVGAVERRGEAEVEEEGGVALGETLRQVSQRQWLSHVRRRSSRACSLAMTASVRRASSSWPVGAPAASGSIRN